MHEETLFHLALAKPADERAAFLDRECAGDPALRRHVEALLQAHEHPGSFLANPAVGPISTAHPETGDNAAATPGPADPVGPGCRIGPYKLMQKIGEGGMGTVWRAEQPSLDRTVALKLVRAGIEASPAELQRFRGEAEAVAHLDHPHIVPVYEVGEDQGRHYFSMKLVEGGSLAQAVQGGGWPVAGKEAGRRAARLVARVARAVHHAHQRGILHRDLKPANVLLEWRAGDVSPPMPYVSDFGLARRVERDSGLTQSGMIVGTPAYVAPEQASGRRDGVTVAADVYGLGAILYELLSGRPPFQGSSVLETLLLVREAEPARPATFNPAVDRDLETICLKCLRKEPGRRYASAAGLADDLDRWLKGEPIVARPVGRPERAWRWCRRNPVATGLLAALLLLVSVATGLILVAREREQEAEARREAVSKNERLEEANQRAERNEQEARTAEKQTEVARREAAQMRYSRQVELARQEWEKGEVVRSQELLEEVRPLAVVMGGGKEPAFEWRLLRRLTQWHRQVALYGHANGVSGVSFSPDGTRLASAGGVVTVREVQTGREVLTLRNEEGLYGTWFSPDGQRLATLRGGELVKIWDARTGQELLTLREKGATLSALCFSPDGQRLAGVGMAGPLLVWDARTGQRLLAAPTRMNGIVSICFSTDGQRLACGCGNGGFPCEARVWDARTGEHVLTLWGHTDGVADVCPSPDGRWLATAGRDRTVRVWDARTGQELRTLWGHTDEVIRVCFSPDGKRLASASHDRTVRVWDAWTGQELFALHGHVNGVGCVSFSPDGQLLASGSIDRTVRVWDARTGQQETTTRSDLGEVRRVCFSPDSQCLAYAVADGPGGEVRLWDPRTERVLRTLLREKRANGWDDAKGASAVCFSPDGQRVAAGCTDAKVRVWEARTGREVLTLREPTPGVVTVSFHPDGQRLATAHNDGTVIVWDARTRQEVRTWRAKMGGLIQDACFSPDGKWLASAAAKDPTVKVWDAQTGEERLTLRGHKDEVFHVSFSGDGQRLASASEDGTVKVWDAQTGQELLSLQGNTRRPWRTCFSPDGKRLATSNWEGVVQLWDAQTGQELLSLRGHRSDVESLCFSPDGQRLASADIDGLVKVWDARPVPDQLMLRGHKDRVRSVSFSPDGEWLVSQEFNREIVWDLRSGQSLPDAKVPNPVPGPLSPDGKRFANVEHNLVRLVDLSERPDLRDECPWLRSDPDWDREEADLAERHGQWFAAAFHHRRLLNDYEPWNAERHLRLGYALEQQGQTEEAAVPYLRAVLLEPRVRWEPPRPRVVPPPAIMPRVPEGR
jgi:WD40 repeat protein